MWLERTSGVYSKATVMMVVAAFFLLASPSASCSSGGSKELARRLFSGIDFDRAASITIAPSLEGVVLKREEASPRWKGMRDAQREGDWLKLLSLAGRKELDAFPSDEEIERLHHRLINEQWTVVCEIDTSKCKHPDYSAYLWCWNGWYRAWGRGDADHRRVSVKIDLGRNSYGMVLAYPDKADRLWMQDLADGKPVSESRDGGICAVKEPRYLPRVSELEYYGSVTIMVNTKIIESMRSIGRSIVPGWFEMLQLAVGCIVVFVVLSLICAVSFVAKMRMNGNWDTRPLWLPVAAGVLFLIAGGFKCMFFCYLPSAVLAVWAIVRDVKKVLKREKDTVRRYLFCLAEVSLSVLCFISAMLGCLAVLYAIWFVAAVVCFIWFGPAFMHFQTSGHSARGGSEPVRCARATLQDGTVIEEDSPGSSDWHGVDGHEGRYTRVDSDTFKKKAAWQ